jgi:hypothetical protein
LIIPLEKLIAFNGNRYVFTRAAMIIVDKLGNLKDYPEQDESWKVVPNILNYLLNDKIKYHLVEEQ